MGATYTNQGLNLLATALQTNGAQVAITWVAIGTGCGTLASALTSGTAYTALSLAAGLPAPLASGQSLTLLNTAGDSETVTTSASVLAGATSIPITSHTPTHTFGIGSGVTTTPAATDTALYNETYRLAATPGSAGASYGESLNPAYFDPTAPGGTYVEVGYYAGSTAGSGAGTGTLMARDTQLWIHTLNADSGFYQLDTTISLT
ncbi:MAG TPA: hypothetical protein VFN78_02540 [Ktedonobacterales bacterium]|nr:hypothetical protein [Ktedonobacterales bacterium]